MWECHFVLLYCRGSLVLFAYSVPSAATAVAVAAAVLLLLLLLLLLLAFAAAASACAATAAAAATTAGPARCIFFYPLHTLAKKYQNICMSMPRWLLLLCLLVLRRKSGYT